MTSSILDVSNKQNCLLIAENLERMKLFCINQAKAINDLKIKNLLKSLQIQKVKYSLDVYHVKEVSNVFSRLETKLESILKVWKIFERLKENKVEVCIYPVGIVCGKFDLENYLLKDVILYPKLNSNDWNLGLPSSREDFEIFYPSLLEAFKSIHDAGVIHMDAYPSNIFWKKDSKNTISIRIVDWDVASFFNEPLDSNIVERMQTRSVTDFYWVDNTTIAKFEHDLWFLYVFSKLTDEDLQLLSQSSTSVLKLNSTFQGILRRIKSNVEEWRSEFNTWKTSIFSS